jgi:UMF1 family MFS transporter
MSGHSADEEKRLKDVLTNRKVVAWALYDWGNSAFATTVLAAFFPAFYKQYWSVGVDTSTSTFQLGMGHALASALIVVLAPVLGAIADSGGSKKRFLAAFALLGVGMTAALGAVAEGQWLLAIAVFVLANVGFSAANAFYDSLLVSVSRPEQFDIVSAFGFALGYIGGGLLFTFNLATVVWPEFFGLADATEAVRLSFFCVAVWWLLFSVPLMVYVPEPRGRVSDGAAQAIRSGLRQLLDTLHEIRRLRVVLTFLIAYWLYIDGVHTIVRMAVDYGMALGFHMEQLLTALLITQFVAFPSALFFGFLGGRIGAKAAILIAIGVYIVTTVGAVFMDEVRDFYVLAVVIGLVQGGVQSLSRSMYARLIPADKSAEYFGFYNMLGKFAAILGPLMVGFASLATGSPRLSLLSIVVLFVAGAALLYHVDESRGARIAHELEH